MVKIKIENISYYTHPVYDLYAASRRGKIANIERQAPMRGTKQPNGYLLCMVRSCNDMKHKTYYVHRFVYECFNGIIPEGMVVDHVNDVKDDNRLSNLQLITQQENCKKSAKNRDYSFVANNHKNRKRVKATNIETGEVTYFNSMSAAGKYLGINPGIISYCCQGINNCKSGISKIDGQHYKLEYVE